MHNKEMLRKAQTSFLKNEPLGVSKYVYLFGRIFLGREKSIAGLSLYVYLRNLDDCVDSGRDTVQAKQILLQEHDYLTQLSKLDQFPKDIVDATNKPSNTD